MADEQHNLQMAARLGELWNSGRHDELLDLYHDDVVMTAAANWIDPGPWVGKEQVNQNQQEWASAWQEIEMAVDRVEAAGDKVVFLGTWHSRGAASGIGSTTPVAIVFTFDEGLIRRLDFFEDAEQALRAAGLPA
ncbi:MAG TPA: nuclear transport factor 2 family protein [Thermoleophilaceae bacterium]|nr:nuclear transport factor 2 family protein [Thermoleophilaceae bacterium]